MLNEGKNDFFFCFLVEFYIHALCIPNVLNVRTENNNK